MKRAASTALALSVLSGCQLIAGITDRSTGRADASVSALSCLREADCAGGELCLFGACSHTCRKDGDCPAGQRCLGTNDGAACVLPERATCAGGEPCPTGTACHDGQCRSDCVDSFACAEDQRCLSASRVCVGTSAAHDP